VIRSGLIIELELVGRSNEVYLSPGLGKKIIVSAMKRFLQFLFVAAAGLGLAGQEDPHSVDKCDILPRAGAHQCHCPKMVSDVQQEYVDRCVRESKTKDEYRECMAKMPEHCDIVAYPSRYGAGEHKDQCKTTCKPERCFCNDGSCPPHQPSEEEVKSARW